MPKFPEAPVRKWRQRMFGKGTVTAKGEIRPHFSGTL